MQILSAAAVTAVFEFQLPISITKMIFRSLSKHLNKADPVILPLGSMFQFIDVDRKEKRKWLASHYFL
jgi:hypothetical protein